MDNSTNNPNRNEGLQSLDDKNGMLAASKIFRYNQIKGIPNCNKNLLD